MITIARCARSFFIGFYASFHEEEREREREREREGEKESDSLMSTNIITCTVAFFIRRSCPRCVRTEK